jgi:vacuolar-type H+-ATPase subunit E/Vma4
MGVNYDALPEEAKIAISWKARQNLNMTLGEGSDRTQANQQKFLENNQESLASNAEGVKHILKEYKENLPLIHED